MRARFCCAGWSRLYSWLVVPIVLAVTAFLAVSLGAVGVHAQGAFSAADANANGPSDSGSGWLARLNDIRAMAGLPPVTENAQWSEDCWLHARYMAETGTITHYEDPSNPWYTPEGGAAGAASNVILGLAGTAAIDGWASAPFHAVGMLDPQLAVVGFGSYEVSGRPSAAALNVISGRGDSPGISYPVMWPGPGSVSPYTRFLGGEIPDPLSGTGYSGQTGLPIIVQFEQVPVVTASHIRLEGAELEHVVVTETSYANPDPAAQDLGRAVLGARHAVLLIPRDPLLDSATYSVELVCDGRSYSWSFSTANMATTTSTEPPTTSTTLPASTTTQPATTTTQSSTTTTQPPTTTTTKPRTTFVDVGPGHPYGAAIEDLAARGIVDGYDESHFAPSKLVVRQQFAKLIDLTLALPVSEADSCPFGDVQRSGSTSLYPDNYVAVCAKYGITQGVRPGSFAPWQNISRAQAITMIVRAVEKLHPGLLKETTWYGVWENFDPVHARPAATAEANGLLTGLPLREIKPWDPMPRGEVAQVFHNLLQKLEAS